MKVKVLYFAQLSEKLGANNEEVEVSSDCGSDELIELLKNNHPVLNELTFTVAVNHTLIKQDTSLEDGFEIALLPPFAGG